MGRQQRDGHLSTRHRRPVVRLGAAIIMLALGLVTVLPRAATGAEPVCPTPPDDLCADVGVTVFDAPDPAAAGADLVYTLVVSNGGPWQSSPSAAVWLAPGLQLQSFSEVVLGTSGTRGCTAVNTSEGQGILDPVLQRLLAAVARPGQAGTAVICKLGQLEPGSDHPVTVVVRPSPELEGQVVETVAAVAGDRGDPNLDNNTDSETTTIRTPAIFIDDVVVAEGTGAAVFTVSRSAASVVNLMPVTVDYATSDGSAVANEDYVSTRGRLTFFPGDVILRVRVPIMTDSLYEASETFFVDLTGSTNAAIGDGQGQGTIADDDPEPSLSIDDVAVMEGDVGMTRATLTVSLSAASGTSTMVRFATADGSAGAPRDYAVTSGWLSWASGEQTKTISVLVSGDRARESDESFFVNLTSASGAQVSDGQGIITIINDDGRAGS